MLNFSILREGFKQYKNDFSSCIYCPDDMLVFNDYCYNVYLKQTQQSDSEATYDAVLNIMQAAYNMLQDAYADDEILPIDDELFDDFVYCVYKQQSQQKAL